MTVQDHEQDVPIERGEPLREAVYARIVKLISSGEYPPGAALTEASLSRSLQVSRTPVREALLRLEAEGVLRSTLARGFTVRPLVRRETAELYPILAALEGLAIQAAVPMEEARIGQLGAVLAELESCADPIRCWQLDTQFHSTVIAASGNGHLLSMVSQLRTNLSRYELTYMREVPSRVTADREHRDILNAIIAGESARAAELLQNHWLNGMRVIQEWIDAGDVR